MAAVSILCSICTEKFYDCDAMENHLKCTHFRSLESFEEFSNKPSSSFERNSDSKFATIKSEKSDNIFDSVRKIFVRELRIFAKNSAELSKTRPQRQNDTKSATLIDLEPPLTSVPSFFLYSEKRKIKQEPLEADILTNAQKVIKNLFY